MPLWQNVPVEDLSSQLDTLMFLDVVANGAGPRFLIRFLGTRIAQSYGDDFSGRFLDEALPPAWRDNAMKTYGKAAETRLPVYNMVDTGDTQERSSTWSGCCCRSPATGRAPTGSLLRSKP